MLVTAVEWVGKGEMASNSEADKVKQNTERRKIKRREVSDDKACCQGIS